ncbi:MAG: rod-binding protein [Fusobacteriota bacterium]
MISNKMGLQNLQNNINTDNLKKQAELTKEKEKLKQVTEEFEAIFIKMTLDAMDKTVDRKDGLFHGGQSEEIFRDMLNDERSKGMSKSGGFGLAKSMYDQLSKTIK